MTALHHGKLLIGAVGRRAVSYITNSTAAADLGQVDYSPFGNLFIFSICFIMLYLLLNVQNRNVLSATVILTRIA